MWYIECTYKIQHLFVEVQKQVNINRYRFLVYAAGYQHCTSSLCLLSSIYRFVNLCRFNYCLNVWISSFDPEIFRLREPDIQPLCRMTRYVLLLLTVVFSVKYGLLFTDSYPHFFRHISFATTKFTPRNQIFGATASFSKYIWTKSRYTLWYGEMHRLSGLSVKTTQGTKTDVQ